MIFDSESCQTCNSCRERTPSISRIELRTSSIETVEGTPWRRMKDALRTLTDYQLHASHIGTDIPRGKADENMITVITRLITGSK